MMVNTCCGCVSLRTGSFIIGYMKLFLAIIGILSIVFVNVASADLIRDAEIDDADKDAATLAINILMGVTLAMLAVLLLFIVFLLVGLHMNKPSPVMVYLIFDMIVLILYVIMCIYNWTSTPVKPGNVAGDVFGIALTLYFWVVIKSYHCVLKEENEHTKASNEPSAPIGTIHI